MIGKGAGGIKLVGESVRRIGNARIPQGSVAGCGMVEATPSPDDSIADRDVAGRRRVNQTGAAYAHVGGGGKAGRRKAKTQQNCHGGNRRNVFQKQGHRCLHSVKRRGRGICSRHFLLAVPGTTVALVAVPVAATSNWVFRFLKSALSVTAPTRAGKIFAGCLWHRDL